MAQEKLSRTCCTGTRPAQCCRRVKKSGGEQTHSLALLRALAPMEGSPAIQRNDQELGLCQSLPRTCKRVPEAGTAQTLPVAPRSCVQEIIVHGQDVTSNLHNHTRVPAHAAALRSRITGMAHENVAAARGPVSRVSAHPVTLVPTSSYAVCPISSRRF